ncbi:hypothetical protein DYB30_007419 [Aphanomyces astaci]|uniref:PPIase cyclophilin-type domain-containing protein n=1 Tax=Aphanomyces astaci TaxID=112090 RepID=A0A397D1S9_APHAT|nr:hypothetical protein DYB30_007419 [Aphanomyces astaci]
MHPTAYHQLEHMPLQIQVICHTLQMSCVTNIRLPTLRRGESNRGSADNSDTVAGTTSDWMTEAPVSQSIYEFTMGSGRGNPVVYLDIAIGHDPLRRLRFEGFMFKCGWLNGKHVAFGQVIAEDLAYLKDFEDVGSSTGLPLKPIAILNAGQLCGMNFADATDMGQDDHDDDDDVAVGGGGGSM